MKNIKREQFAILLFFVLFLTVPFNTFGDEKPVSIPKLNKNPKIDGKLNESCWKQARKLDLPYETTPGENIPAPVKTEIFVFYSQTHLYFALICHDPDPRLIRARYSNRDTIFNDDLININLDTFNDERRNYFLGCNPLGVQRDGIETEHGNPSWDTIWDSVGRITEKGYIIEIAIPFSSIQFPRTKGKQIWGLDISRFYQRDFMHRFGLVKIDRNNNSYQSQFMKIIGFENVKPGKNIEIIPTLTGTKSSARDPFPDGKFSSTAETLDPGLTAKFGITSNLTVSGTINPDFSQVEADSRQLDINQPFALFFMEKRPFFTEGSDFFTSPLDIIYTRTMREPEWGLKLSGKEGKNTIGAYFVRDEITNIIFPGNQGSNSLSIDNKSTSAVLRYKRDLGRNFTLGSIITNRQSGEYYNRVFGVDLETRLSNRNRVRLQIVRSNTKYDNLTAQEFGQAQNDFSGNAIKLTYNYTSRNLNIFSQYKDVGKDFRADMGFIPMVDYRNFLTNINYRWLKNKGLWSEIMISSMYKNVHSQDGAFLEESIEFSYSIQGIKQTHLYMEYEYARELYNDFIYKLDKGYGNFRINLLPDLQIFFRYKIGDQIDYSNSRQGNRFNLSSGLNFNMGTHMKLSIDHRYEKLNVNKEKLYVANVVQMSLMYHFNTRLFIRGIVQYMNYNRNTSNYLFEIDPEYKDLFTQFLFSYQLNPRTVVFLGYTDNYLGYREYKSNYDVPLKQKSRTLFLKLSYSWQI